MSASNDREELYLVFSRPSDEVSDEEFQAWYDRHLPEILETPGFESARRYRVTPVMYEGDEPPPYRWLVLWETTKDIDELRAALTARSESGDMVPLPEWFTKTQYMTWSCVPYGDRITRSDA
jgi:heme-degrading monooxygenase HmoA